MEINQKIIIKIESVYFFIQSAHVANNTIKTMDKYLSNTGIWRFVFLTIAEYSDRNGYIEDEYTMINNLARTNKFMAKLSRNIKNEMVQLLKRERTFTQSCGFESYSSDCCSRGHSYDGRPDGIFADHMSWRKHGKLHRDNNNIALIEINKGTYWYVDGKKHRDDGPAEISRNGVEKWYKDGLLHRDGDLPAVIKTSANGNNIKEKWYKNGIQHRDNDLPAETTEDGNGNVTKEKWFKNGKQHRDNDKPALFFKYSDGTCLQIWSVDGECHRENDQPALIFRNNDKEWHVNGQLHRDNDLPAKISTRSREWYKNGKLHRDGGKPAIDYKDGAKEWWFEGKRKRFSPTGDFGDKPTMINKYGSKMWHNESGALHRDNDLPAIVCLNGNKTWYKNGVKHRDHNKPAQIFADGTKEWWFKGKQYKEGEQTATGVIEMCADNIKY